MTEEQIAKRYIGRIVGFEPDETNPNLIYLGQVTDCVPTDPLPGGIPDFIVSIQGRTGKSWVGSLVKSWVFVANDWDEALYYQKERTA